VSFFGAPTKATNKVATIPAPIGGLNARDSLAAMPTTDAIILQNWWPQPYGLSVRKGYRKWATELGGTVGSLAPWSGADGTQKLFAWANGKFFDVTSQGPVGAPIYSGLSNDYWQDTQLVNAAGAHLLAVNGADDGVYYGPTGAARITVGAGAGQWNPIDPKNCAQLTVHQHRLWAVERGTANGWFLPPDAIAGTFQKFDFGPLFGLGGYLQYLTTWTLDDGNGAEDHLVAVSSTGLAAVYGGTDPTDDTKWELVGVYNIGAPVSGRRSFVKAGGDILILTQQGVVSLASQLASTKVNEAADILASKKIQFLISELTSTYSDLTGWELQYYPKINMLLVNVPSVVAGGNIQLASNQIINSWTQFTGMDASCWSTFNSTPYFGDYGGNVYVAWYGNEDGVDVDGTGGTSIVAVVQQAYSYLGEGATQKQVGMYRPTLVVSSPITLGTKILYDFQPVNIPTPTGNPAPTDSLWGTDLWGTGIWGGGDQIQKAWIQAQGMGVTASLGMAVQTSVDVLWVATDYSYVAGFGIL